MTTAFSDAHAQLLDSLAEAMRVGSAQWGKIRVLSGEGLHIEAQRGFSNAFLEAFATVAVKDNVPAARALASGRRVSMANLANDPCSAEYKSVASSEGFRAMQTTVLVGSGGRPVGTLSTCFADVYFPSAAETLVLDHSAAKAARVVEEAFRGRT
jgi:hypothetical protein